MASTELPLVAVPTAAGGLIQRALQVLAEATGATAMLFDRAGELTAGPVAGNAFMRQVLASETGRSEVIAAHRAAFSFLE